MDRNEDTLRAGNIPQEAFYKMVRMDGGVSKSFEIRFTVDEDGIWRLRMF